MDLDAITLLAGLVLGIALATERLIVSIKSAIPTLDEDWQRRENVRRLIVQVMAFLIAWIGAAYVGEGGLLGEIPVSDQVGMPVILVGLLGSGGSAFWKDVLGWTNSMKELQAEAANKARTANVEVPDEE